MVAPPGCQHPTGYEAHSIDEKIRQPQHCVKPTWPNSLASLLLHCHQKSLPGFRVSLVGAVTRSISQADQSVSAESARGWVIIFTSSYPWALRGQSLAYSSSWNPVQRTFNHVLNQLNWKTFSGKLPGANFYVLC